MKQLHFFVLCLAFAGCGDGAPPAPAPPASTAAAPAASSARVPEAKPEASVVTETHVKHHAAPHERSATEAPPQPSASASLFDQRF